jgi:hypothetical protein
MRGFVRQRLGICVVYQFRDPGRWHDDLLALSADIIISFVIDSHRNAQLFVKYFSMMVFVRPRKTMDLNQ